LDKHPQLSQYVICLPIDRQDPRIKSQQWFMDKWNAHVQKWEEWAAAKGMAVVFEYWGSYQLFERLSREEHRGRFYFWFHRDLFSQEWFRNRVEEAIVNVGPRYSPELDMQIPIARLFHGLGRTSEFFMQIRDLLKEVYVAIPRREETFLNERTQQLSEALDRLRKLLDTVDQSTVERIEWGDVKGTSLAAMNFGRECARIIASLAEDRAKGSHSLEKKEEVRRLRYRASRYRRLSQTLLELHEYALSDEASLSNLPALLLVAEAGRGKTHLFCDVARLRIQRGLRTVLLIGGQFTRSEPWAQMTGLLGLSCTREEFLGALEAAAQAHHTRAVILIDALNEGQGKALWSQHLAGILLNISRSPWLGVAISVRTSYEDTVVPEGLVPSRLIRAEHYGFAEHEYEATKTFFEYFGIQRPSIPPLVPEFQNPLFLKIFCQGLKNNRLISAPPGLQGITAIFKFFIDSVNQKLADAEYLDFNRTIPIVWRAVEGLAAQLAQQGKDWLPIEEAQEIFDQILPSKRYEHSLFRHLLSEGVIAENRFYTGDSQWSEGVHFAYERFTDHLVAKHLLDAHLDADDPASSFAPATTLGKYVQDEHACANYRGLIEAFAIQLPERLDKELIELVPSIQGFDAVISAFIESIIWRQPYSITVDVVMDYIKSSAIRNLYHRDQLFNALLTVAGNPKYPLNADFLHQNLLQQELAERDSWWSVFLGDQYSSHSSVDRLVEWAWSPDDKSHIEEESIRLYGVALAWFLSTSNRYLRDRATKALVRLFTRRIDVLHTVIQGFVGVNDPYVFERLMAVAYGCAMRSEDSNAIGPLALNVYTWVFRDGHPPAHILLRDYARGVVEVAVHRGTAQNIDLSKVRPPYNSTFPDEIPTEEELSAKYDNFDSAKRDIDYAQSTIWFSVMGGGDFARYIIGTNDGSFEWSSRRLGRSYPLTRNERYEAFIATLTPGQRRAFEKYKSARSILALYHRAVQMGLEEHIDPLLTDEQVDNELQATERQLRKQLGKKKSAQLSDDILRYIDHPHEEEFRFDLSLAQRWILHRVFELGWTVERFGAFDRFINYRDGRAAAKPERIGKKYQWIAYHEFLARVSDNFELREERWGEPKVGKYEGPWQMLRGVRDIDPSWVLPRTHATESLHGFEPTWWAPAQLAWDNRLTDREWIQDSKDLPGIESFLTVTNPHDHSRWLTLESVYYWENVAGDANDSLRFPKRIIQYFLKSYIVKHMEIDELCASLKTQWRAGTGVSMPESQPTYRVFFGEFFWAPTFLYHNVPYFHRGGWVGGNADDMIFKPILLTTDQYARASGDFDCSVDGSIRSYLPCKWIADQMGLYWSGIEGHFYDASGNPMAFDPSIQSPGPGALLIKREPFLTHLYEHGYALLWVLTGSKMISSLDVPGNNWPGRLDIFGVFRIKNNKIDCQMDTRMSE
jgi:hypothetical protein